MSFRESVSCCDLSFHTTTCTMPMSRGTTMMDTFVTGVSDGGIDRRAQKQTKNQSLAERHCACFWRSTLSRMSRRILRSIHSLINRRIKERGDKAVLVIQGKFDQLKGGYCFSHIFQAFAGLFLVSIQTTESHQHFICSIILKSLRCKASTG